MPNMNKAKKNKKKKHRYVHVYIFVLFHTVHEKYVHNSVWIWKSLDHVIHTEDGYRNMCFHGANIQSCNDNGVRLNRN